MIKLAFDSVDYNSEEQATFLQYTHTETHQHTHRTLKSNRFCKLELRAIINQPVFKGITTHLQPNSILKQTSKRFKFQSVFTPKMSLGYYPGMFFTILVIIQK